MSVILAVDTGDFYKILSDSAINSGNLQEIRPGGKVFKYGPVLLASVGSFSKGQVWQRAVRQIHGEYYNHVKEDYFKSGEGDIRLSSLDLIEKIIDRASEIGFELYREFDFSHSRFIKIKSKVYYVESAFHELVEDTYKAIGSGRQYVYGAMDSNQVDPRVAMKIACKRDPSCALPIHQLRVRKYDGKIYDDGEV